MRCLFVAMIYILCIYIYINLNYIWGIVFFHDFYQWLERSTALNMERSNSQGFFRKKKKMVVKLDTFGFEMEKGGSFRHKSACSSQRVLSQWRRTRRW